MTPGKKGFTSKLTLIFHFKKMVHKGLDKTIRKVIGSRK